MELFVFFFLCVKMTKTCVLLSWHVAVQCSDIRPTLRDVMVIFPQDRYMKNLPLAVRQEVVRQLKDVQRAGVTTLDLVSGFGRSDFPQVHEWKRIHFRWIVKCQQAFETLTADTVAGLVIKPSGVNTWPKYSTSDKPTLGRLQFQSCLSNAEVS